MKRIIFHNEAYSSFALNLGLLILRVYFGLAMAFAHGLGKVPPKAGFVGYLTSMSLPMPTVMAWGAGLSEFLGGLFLALGLATRLSSASWIVTMGVAAFVAHGSDPFKKTELSLAYLAVGVFFFLTGSGKFSIDGLINKK